VGVRRPPRYWNLRPHPTPVQSPGSPNSSSCGWTVLASRSVPGGFERIIRKNHPSPMPYSSSPGPSRAWSHRSASCTRSSRGTPASGSLPRPAGPRRPFCSPGKCAGSHSNSDCRDSARRSSAARTGNMSPLAGNPARAARRLARLAIRRRLKTRPVVPAAPISQSTQLTVCSSKGYENRPRTGWFIPNSQSTQLTSW
jgi:hypothetical protein